MSDKPPEQRRWKFIGKIEADTWDDLINQFRQLEIELYTRKEGEIPFSICGAPHINWVFTITEKPDMTHDKYFEELNAYLEAEKEKERAGNNHNPGLQTTSGEENTETPSSG